MSVDIVRNKENVMFIKCSDFEHRIGVDGMTQSQSLSQIFTFSILYQRVDNIQCIPK